MGSSLVEQKVLFSKEECDYLKTLFNESDFKKSKVSENNKYDKDSNLRTSYDIYLHFSVDKKNLLLDKIKQIGIIENPNGFAVLRYDIGQEFKRHRDNIGAQSKKYENRYKTIIIQLSDENEYQGGDLVIYENEKEIVASKKIGNTIIFHSSLEHELKKLTNGRRYCIVFWTEKKNFALKNDLI